MSGCGKRAKPDISKVMIVFRSDRFDHDLYTNRDRPLEVTDSILAAKYGTFYQDYAYRMVGNGSYTTAQVINYVYKDKAYLDLQKETDSIFKDLKPFNNQLEETFKYIKYYYPEVKVPRFVYFVSGFAVQTPIGDGYLGIGLDMFLGRDSKFYGAIVQSVPRYISRRFTPEYLVPRATETFAREDLFPEKDEDKTLLSKMVHNGKILYFMDQVLPEKIPDSVKIGYTKKQMDWCKKYEGDIWAYYLQNNLLYETDPQAIQVYLTEGPFTPGLGEKNESAPKLGVWTGWQIVRKYMEEHKEITLQQLMAEKDAQKILKDAKYKPKMQAWK